MSDTPFHYKKIKISKKNGKFRDIYIPNDTLKSTLIELLPTLNDIYFKNVIFECDHAFVKGKNCATNAKAHINNRYILSVDIEDFFDSITENHVRKLIKSSTLDIIMIKGKLPQGYNTSPCVANIAMIEIDKNIINSMNDFNKDIIYTRYADDLTFSFNNLNEKNFILSELVKILRFYGFRINKRKTLLQDKNNGRAIITGIGVSFDNIHPTRKTLKKIRAAQHQENENSLRGLLDWSLCKIPHKRSV